jgi:hypothetical protein
MVRYVTCIQYRQTKQIKVDQDIVIHCNTARHRNIALLLWLPHRYGLNISLNHLAVSDRSGLEVHGRRA